MEREAWKRKLGQNIKKFRQEKGLTQEQAAGQYDCTARHWQRLEEGSQNPSAAVLVKLARMLGIKPSRLLEW